MTRIRLIMLSLLAVFAVSAVASASASATEGIVEWKIGGNPFTGTETETSKGGVFTLKAGITIECKKVKDTGSITQVAGKAGTDATTVEFEECAIPGNANCTVTSENETNEGAEVNGTITVKAKTELFEPVETTPDIHYDRFTGEEAEGRFVTIEVDNAAGKTCLVKGEEYTVTGKACAEAGPEAVKAKLTFSKAIEEACGTGLKLKGVAAEFKGVTEQELSGANKGKTISATDD
jgi:hypothetical protein